MLECQDLCCRAIQFLEKRTQISPFCGIVSSCLKFWEQRRRMKFWLLINDYFLLHISFLPSLIKPDTCEPQTSPRSVAICMFTCILGCSYLCPVSYVLFTSFPSHLNPLTLVEIHCHVHWWPIFCPHNIYGLIPLLFFLCQLGGVLGGTMRYFYMAILHIEQDISFFPL